MALSLPDTEHVLGTLKPGHPRLLINDKTWRQVRHTIDIDPIAADWHQRILSNADHYLQVEPVVHAREFHDVLLGQSRRMMARSFTLAYAMHMTGDRRYLDRLWREAEAVIAFPDWGHTHFLDTAEMANGLATAYDWCYHCWSDDQRNAMADAIVSKAIDCYLAAWDKTLAGTYKQSPLWWWIDAEHNWNQVCNGGIAIAALAIAEHDMAKCSRAVATACRALPRAMRHLAPDGAWNEGPMYWYYAMLYNVSFIAALDSALGTCFELDTITGFDRTAWFAIHLTSPNGFAANFADAKPGHVTGWPLFWLDRRFNLPQASAHHHRVAPLSYTDTDESLRAKPHPLDLVYYQPADQSLTGPATACFRGAEMAAIRSDWTTEALYIACKAGDNQANHSHLDLGSFILDARGQRWISELGVDDYALPDYFETTRLRWHYYRLDTPGQNTLLFNPGRPPHQQLDAKATLTTGGSANCQWLQTDLTQPYQRPVQRGICMINDPQCIIIQDQWSAKAGETIVWVAHTEADAELTDPRTVILQRNDQKAFLQLDLPNDAAFEIQPARPWPGSPDPTGQNPNHEFKRIVIIIHAVRDTDHGQFRVLFHPDELPTGPRPDCIPLTQWSTHLS